LKFTNIVPRQGCARTRWGSLQHSPNPLAGFRGAASRRERVEGKGRWGKEEEEGGWERKEREARRGFAP